MKEVVSAQKPRVSVAMVTYNHEEFLAEAIESVLAQDFEDWELVIGEDCSTDNTLAVATGYETAHPNRIRVLRDKANLGSRNNWMRTVRACRGKFLANLDGDDFWSDSTKLSQQVAWLDRHSECALVFSPTLQDKQSLGLPATVHYPPKRQEFYDLEDLLWGNFIGSGSVLWRELDVEDLPDWFQSVPVGDWPLHVLCAQKGRIGYIDKVMSVHREHDIGVWSKLSNLARVQQRLDVREFFRNHFGQHYREVFDAADLKDHFHLAKTHRRGGQAIRAYAELLWCLQHRCQGRKPTVLRLAAEALRVIAPTVLMLGLGSFALYGLLAATEPGTHWIWSALYVALGLLSVYGLLSGRCLFLKKR